MNLYVVKWTSLNNDGVVLSGSSLEGEGKESIPIEEKVIPFFSLFFFNILFLNLWAPTSSVRSRNLQVDFLQSSYFDVMNSAHSFSKELHFHFSLFDLMKKNCMILFLSLTLYFFFKKEFLIVIIY